MACERVDISILVVDDDETSLAIVANILILWEYKVLTANSARNALETLREFEGFFDLVITELHISGIDGFEFQKRIKDEFQLPVIMMSADRRKNVMSKSLKNGAALYILKPICANDFKDIWKYAIAARNEKIVIENELRSREGQSPCENIISLDVATSSLTEPNRKRKYSKRKRTQMNKKENSSPVPKKPKIVWTTYLHNLFLLAIKQIGFDRAVPKRILEIMNVPNLTRENIASHLQKYRIFLRKVAERGIIEGLSDRTLRSRFASGLSASVIKDIQTRSEKLRVPVKQYLKRLAHQTGTRGIVNALHDQQVSSSAYVTNQLGRGQFPYPRHNGLMLQNQPGENFGSNIGANNFQPKMFGSYANPPYQANCSYNNGMGHCLMTSANGLTRRGLRYGDQMYQNYDSLGTNKFSNGLGNRNMGSLSTSNLPWTSTSYPSRNSSVIQLNGGSKTVGTGNNDSFGLINETQNTNMNVANLGHGNFGLVQGGLASTSDSNAVNGFISELPTTLMTNGTREENISGIPQLPQQLDDNVAGNELQYNASSISDGEIISSQLEDDLSELFLKVDEMQLLNIETEENPDASEFLNSDFSCSSHVVQSFEQSNSRASDDVIVLPTKDTSNLPNESPTSSDKNSNQMQGNEEFADWEYFDSFLVDNVSLASNSTIEQDWDMDIVEALFGTEVN